MKPGTIQRIFNDHYARHRRTHQLSTRERWAAYNIKTCRTAEQGYHIDECPEGHYRTIQYNSCKHRSCPLCGLFETEKWIRQKQEIALACRYFHCIFTIPCQLHIIWLYNRSFFVNLYFQAAWHTLRDFFDDPRWLGAMPGVIGAFQSSGETLYDHLHLHFIVTGGGMTKNGCWVSARDSFLLPSRAVADKFRGKFCAYLREAFEEFTEKGRRKAKSEVLNTPPGMSKRQCLNLLNKLGRKKWHVEIKPPYEYPDGVIKYLARYIRRGPVSEKRICSYDGEIVRIAYKHSEGHKKDTFVLPAQEFVRRILMHVPAKGVHLVRNFGLFHPSRRRQLDQARLILGQPPLPQGKPVKVTREELRNDLFPHWDGDLCPICGRPLVTTIVCYRGHSPPARIAA